MKLLPIFMLIIFVCGGFAGFYFNDLMSEWGYKKMVNGLYFKYGNETSVFKTAREIEPYGQWICVNVRNMKPQEALYTCQHEVGHEIFANYCENHIEECMNLTQNLKGGN